MRTARAVLHFASMLLALVQDALRFLLLGTRSNAALKAENIFLREPLALYLEREAKPHRAMEEAEKRLRTLCLLALVTNVTAGSAR